MNQLSRLGIGTPLGAFGMFDSGLAPIMALGQSIGSSAAMFAAATNPALALAAMTINAGRWNMLALFALLGGFAGSGNSNNAAPANGNASGGSGGSSRVGGHRRRARDDDDEAPEVPAKPADKSTVPGAKDPAAVDAPDNTAKPSIKGRPKDKSKSKPEKATPTPEVKGATPKPEASEPKPAVPTTAGTSGTVPAATTGALVVDGTVGRPEEVTLADSTPATRAAAYVAQVNKNSKRTVHIVKTGEQAYRIEYVDPKSPMIAPSRDFLKGCGMTVTEASVPTL